MTEWPLQQLAETRKEHNLSWSDLVHAHDWWFSLWRLALARARARSEPRLMRRRVEQAWRLRWCGIISCGAARSFAASLLGLRGGHGSDGQAPPSHKVAIRQRPQ